ncbi:hypothetical protein G9A89_014932 [Geosiphon pyriformis]|nr:hypothetical protein G9A89_014932 [Geosiphon pyriformis]
MTTQFSIFVIGLVVEDALEKNCELWLMLQDMRKVYDSVVMTNFGLMDDYRKIFYNPLLCEIKRQKSLCGYQIDTKFVAKTSRIENQGSLTSFLATVESNQAAIQYILDTVSEFFKINDIFINNEKTVAIPINQRVSNASLSISGLLISIAYRKKSHRYLGIYLSSERLSKPSLAKAHMDVRFFVNLVLKKTISNKQFLYLVLAVLQPIINFFNETLHHSSLYSLKSFEQLQTEYKVVSVLCFSNADGILVLGWSPIHPLCCPIRLHVSPNFLDCGMFFGNFSVSAFRFSGGIPISAVLGASLFYDVFLSLRKFGVAFAEQGPVPHWFTLICSWDIDVCSSDAVSRLSYCLSSANMRVVNVYTDRSLKDLSSCKMKCDAAAYFSDLDMGIGAKIGGLVSSTMAELSVVVYSDSQVVLDACVAEFALVSPDFRNCCWIEWHDIVNLIRKKQLVVSWYKVKGHSGVIDNEHADKLAGLAASFSLVLPVLVREKFIIVTREAVSENICYFACEIFRSINWAYWEVGFGFNVVDDSLLDNVDWFHTASVWHSDSHMTASFTSKSMAGLCSYFLKTLHCRLPIAM